MISRCRSTFALTALAMAALVAAPARAGLIAQLGDAANYAVLTGPNIGNFQLTSDTFITGNIGVGSSDGTTTGTNNNIKFSNGTLTGSLYLGGTNTNGIGGSVTGSINTQVADVATAYNTAKALSITLAGESGTALSLTTVGGVSTLNASVGTLDANGDRVFTISGSAFQNLGNFTISGSSGQSVVINITGNNNFNFNDAISLTGGITANDVLYNVTGTENLGAAANGATINGTIIGINDKFNLDNVLIDGRVIGGRAGQDFQIVSNFSLVQPTVATVPEPSTLVLTGLAGLMGIGYAWSRRKRPPTA